MKLVYAVLAVAFTASGALQLASAQPPAGNQSQPQVSLRVFHLKNAPSAQDANEMYSALRNMTDPRTTRSYFLPSDNVIFVEGPPDQLAIAEKVLADADQPRKTYRLTYTISDMDAGKKLSSQRFSLTAISGQKTTLKQGSRIPVATGSYAASNNAQQTQFSYIDIGMNFDVAVDDMGNGVRLNTTVDQSAIGEDRPGLGPQEPVIRQTTLRGSSFLTPGKPLVLGSLDVPGSTHHLEVQVVLEPLL